MSEVGSVSPALQALYDEERAVPIGRDEDRARIRARVLTTVGMGAGVGGAAGLASAATCSSATGTASAATGAGTAGAAGAATAGAAGAAGAAATLTGKLIVLVLALGAVGGGVYVRATSSSCERRVIAPSVALALDREVVMAPPSISMVSSAITPTVSPASVLAAGGRPVPPRAAPMARVRSGPLPSAPTLAMDVSAPAPAESAPAAPAPAAPAPAAPAPAAPVPAAPEHRARSAAPESAAASSLQYALLARASAALQRGEVQAALELLKLDRTTNPVSALAEEREALCVMALRRLHRDAEARAAATAFESRYPSSVHRLLVNPAHEEAP
jgi:hypothetical protein